MNRNYNKYSAIIAGVILIAVAVYSSFSGGNKVYDYSNPQPIQLDEQEFDTLSHDVEINIKDDGYITQISADDNEIYYLVEPIINDLTQGLSYELAYLKKMDRQTGKVQTLHEFSNIGKFSISQIVYNKEYCFIHITNFDNTDESVQILKMSKETGDFDVIYETSRVTNGGYDISYVSNNFTDDYLIWKEFDPYTENNVEVNEYKIYNIQKDEIITRKFEEKINQRLSSYPTIHENRIVYNILDENENNIIMCKSFDGEEELKVNVYDMSVGVAFYNDDYLAWRSPNKMTAESTIYGGGFSDIYLLDFADEKQFLVDEDALDLKLFGDYIVTVHKDFVNLIDYRNNKKYKYLIEENQQVTPKVVNVTDNYIIINKGFYNDDNSITLTYKAIVK